MTIEIIATILGTLGIAEIIKLIVEKKFSKKQDKIANDKDEFSALRERIDYNEQEINRLNKSQIKANRKIQKLYAFLIDVSKETCSVEDCPLRKIITIDFDELEDDIKNDKINNDVNDNSGN